MSFSSLYITWFVLSTTLTIRQITCIKCYQCSSLQNHACFVYNLYGGYLTECKNVTKFGSRPVCRSISQINYFTERQDVTVIRECAYLYKLPLDCTQSKFSIVHYSLVCECDQDGCNQAYHVTSYHKMLIFIILLFYIIK